MSNVMIKNVEFLSMCEAFPFFLKQYAALVERGHAHPHNSWTNTSRCIYAMLDDKVIGCIVYDYSKVTKMIWVILLAVDESYRRKGVFSALHRELERTAKKLDAKKIANHVHVNNTVSRQANESVGLEVEFFRMVKHLTPDGKPFVPQGGQTQITFEDTDERII